MRVPLSAAPALLLLRLVLSPIVLVLLLNLSPARAARLPANRLDVGASNRAGDAPGVLLQPPDRYTQAGKSADEDRLTAEELPAEGLTAEGLMSVRSIRVLSHSNANASVDPLTPLWPTRFQVQFDEESYFLFLTYYTSGSYTFDFPSRRARVDRGNGRGDAFCGSAFPLTDTPCSHLVVGGMRLLVFPKEKYCCKCCSAEEGCGVLRPDWLTGATYLGKDVMYGYRTTKWNKSLRMDNYYWHSEDNVPMRLYMPYISTTTFRHDTFDKPASFDDSLFAVPTDLDCSPLCYGLCYAMRTNTSSTHSHKFGL